MAAKRKEQEADETFDMVEQETGYSKEMQIESLQGMLGIANRKLDIVQDLGGKYLDLMQQKEANDIERERIKLEGQNSILKYNLANNWLDCVRETLRHQFAKEDKMIDEGFKKVDKAIEAGEWGVAVEFFGKMSEMVSKSPLAAAIEFNQKMKSGNLTLDDF
jgi:hypothetical protein